MVKDRESIHNILFLIYSLYGGGAQKVCCNLASVLAGKYHVIIAYTNETDRQYPVDPRCELVRIPWGRHVRGRIAKKVAGGLQGVSFCRRLKKERHIDISVSFLITMNQVNVLSRCGDRVITSERANPRIYQPEQFWKTRIIYALSDHVVFQSEKIRNFYGKKTQAHSSIIWNPVMVFCTADAERRKRIVALGRLTEQKNYAMLIRSFSEFHKRYPDYTLSIYGDGVQRQMLQNLIESMGMQGSIFLEGNHQDVHRRIRDAEMFVLSSNFEGLSNALLECMTMGIACISTRCEGSEDVIRDRENGLLTDIGNEQQLTEAMLCLAADPSFRIKLEKQAVRDSDAFRLETIAAQWEEIFLK